MKNEKNQCFDINERNDELNKLKLLNITLIKELRKYKEENTRLNLDNEILYSKIKKLEKADKTLKSDFSPMKNEKPHEETIDIVENISQSNHEIREEKLTYYDFTQKIRSCESCGNTFSNEGNISTNSLTHDESNNDGLKCDGNHEGHKDHKYQSCGKSFSHEQKLKKHSHDHEAHKDNKYESCGKSFHVHTGHKYYKCESCGKSFSEKGDLKGHIHSINKGGKYFKCEYCGKKFTQRPNLHRHVTSLHRKKEHNCSICGENFSRSDNLTRHISKYH